MSFPTLYNLAAIALQKAFILRCEYLLSITNGSPVSIPTPVEQNNTHCKICCKRKFSCFSDMII